MIKKFNEYAGEEISREEWPNAPVLDKRPLSDREKLKEVEDVYFQWQSGKIEGEDAMNKISDLIGVNKEFPKRSRSHFFRRTPMAIRPPTCRPSPSRGTHI